MKWMLTASLLLLWNTTLLAQPWNMPHRASKKQSIHYSSIPNIPKTFDPAKAYNMDEIAIIAQIYEPPYQYDYLKRPYILVPVTATGLPKVTFFDKGGTVVKADHPHIAKTTYDIYLKPGIYYQPHCAFGKDQQRELVADDYVYQIKRLASPRTESPIFGLMRNYIAGLDELDKALNSYLQQHPHTTFLDLRKFSLSGAEAIDRYHYRITIKGKYLPFKYWLAMPFFAPIPWEIEQYYAQPALKKRNISLASWPIGTGPYMMTENNPNKQIVLAANPNFHETFFPIEGEARYLRHRGMRLPLVDKIILSIEKESIPRWNKFLQGYYDTSGIAESSFEQAIKLDKNGQPLLSNAMKKKGIRLQTSIGAAIYYLAFNMLDPLVGGYREEQRKLRQAINLAIDNEEYIAIFLNGRGIPANSIIPPAIFGHTTKKPAKKSLDHAKKLLAEAGYPGGKDPKTGKALILHLDATSTGPGDKAQFDWFRKQFAKLGIKLDIRTTLYNQLQDKIQQGKAQIFSRGWLADYPDPENFLFILYGKNAKALNGGVNASNYQNPKADALYQEIRLMKNNAARQQKINQWMEIVRHDMPMIWQFYPITFTLSHQWVDPIKLDNMVTNSLKYLHVDRFLREQQIYAWNNPVVWPFVVFFAFISILAIVLLIAYKRRDHQRPTRYVEESND